MEEARGRKLIAVLHNVFSPQRVVEAARIVYGLGYDVLVVTKASGSAAQLGVPEAQKIALRENKTLIYLPDLPDAVDLLKPSHVLLVVPPRFSAKELLKALGDLQGRVLIVFGGAEPGLTKRELEMGLPVHIEGLEDIGVVGTMAIALFLARGLTQNFI